jgi:hypothetical protein
VEVLCPEPGSSRTRLLVLSAMSEDTMSRSGLVQDPEWYKKIGGSVLLKINSTVLVKKGILIVLSIFKCLSQTSFPDYFT